jgi:Zn-dependent protease with chaperone function
VTTDTSSLPEANPLIELHARPPRFRVLGEWLRAGAARQTPAVIGALVAAWTGLPFALWAAVVGIFFGAAVGLVGASALGIASVIGLEIGVGVGSAVLGAFLGFLGGLALIYIYLVLHPVQLIGAMVCGAVISAIILTISATAEPFLMQLRGYRQPSRREKMRLHLLLINAGRRMGLSVVPALWISDAQKPGAWAHMRGIVVTRGLLGDYDASEMAPKPDLDDAALTAILAHELHHWDSGDVVGAAAVRACFYPIALVVNGISWVRVRGEWVGILLWCVLWPFWVSTKLVVVPLMTKRTRRYEYEADARAASLGDEYRLGLRRALDELSTWERPRTGWEDVLAATHPPIEHRLERLEALTDAPSLPVEDWVTVPIDVQGTPHELSMNDDAVVAAHRRLQSAKQRGNTKASDAAIYEFNAAVLRWLKEARTAMERRELVDVDLTPDDLDRAIADYDMTTSVEAEALGEKPALRRH